MPIANIKLGRAFGIDVLLHWSFFLLPVTVLWLSWSQGDSLGVTALRMVFLAVILGSVLWHEFGHALMARRFGIPTQDIMLTPICGLARLSKNPASPFQEIIVALAGPLANGFVALVAGAVMLVLGEPVELTRDILQLRMLPAIFWVNTLLFLLNLIPIFPMDGGRVLRAGMASVWDARKATVVSARLGQVISLVVACYGAFSRNFSLVLIGLFLFVAAGIEIQNCRENDDVRRI